ncbi:MAG: dienelactone hydrolase family protein, partial [Calditrichaeota bacterium]|nr:dienelactone hydrolase family protein [Calditrichota bacterium]
DLQEKGIPAEKIILMGFSQGACLALEYAVRNPRQYGGIAALSGGLIGPRGIRWDYGGSLQGTPVFLGCDEEDFHIPKERVEESAQILSEKGAEVTLQFYRHMGHTINEDEIGHVRGMIRLLSGC